MTSCSQKPVQAIDLHIFVDANETGKPAAVYALVYQESFSKGLTIPRLELVPVHMAANLVDVRNA